MSTSVAAGITAPTFTPAPLFSATERVSVSCPNTGALLGSSSSVTVTVTLPALLMTYLGSVELAPWLMLVLR